MSSTVDENRVSSSLADRTTVPPLYWKLRAHDHMFAQCLNSLARPFETPNRLKSKIVPKPQDIPQIWFRKIPRKFQEYPVILHRESHGIFRNCIELPWYHPTIPKFSWNSSSSWELKRGEDFTQSCTLSKWLTIMTRKWNLSTRRVTQWRLMRMSDDSQYPPRAQLFDLSQWGTGLSTFDKFPWWWAAAHHHVYLLHCVSLTWAFWTPQWCRLDFDPHLMCWALSILDSCLMMLCGAMTLSQPMSLLMSLRCLTVTHIPSRPKLLQKNSLQRKCFCAINFVIITKESLYKANSLAYFLVKRDPPVAATLQKNLLVELFL